MADEKLEIEHRQEPRLCGHGGDGSHTATKSPRRRPATPSDAANRAAPEGSPTCPAAATRKPTQYGQCRFRRTARQPAPRARASATVPPRSPPGPTKRPQSLKRPKRGWGGSQKIGGQSADRSGATQPIAKPTGQPGGHERRSNARRCLAPCGREFGSRCAGGLPLPC